ncbi:hypothetical protein L596_012547 [Steinernema carpocapsae]|uniref:non-specific serine/threonine protein kinase n=1 Tax=Steinernema carpocapsae TaxID=34508 RepID=A0A4U5NY78_STECR|nr:hypothetical protein L596_012547 [Steinernema carpocapsae]
MKLYTEEVYIGKGNFSKVYSARSVVTDEIVALKKIEMSALDDEDAKKECLKELDLLMKLQHESIIRCHHSFFDNQQRLVIVMELADQGDLLMVIQDHSKQCRLIPERVIWNYFVQICRGIDHMHKARIMHRDLKPANVFMQKDGVVKLGDLGLSRLFSNVTIAAVSIVGTPYYMSPERIQEGSYDFKSDIWSLGCMLYELAALQSPFYADKKNYASLCRKIEYCEYPPIPSDLYSAQLRHVVCSCLAQSSDKRPDSAHLLIAAEKMHAFFSDLPPVNAVEEAKKLKEYEENM